MAEHWASRKCPLRIPNRGWQERSRRDTIEQHLVSSRPYKHPIGQSTGSGKEEASGTGRRQPPQSQLDVLNGTS